MADIQDPTASGPAPASPTRDDDEIFVEELDDEKLQEVAGGNNTGCNFWCLNDPDITGT